MLVALSVQKAGSESSEPDQPPSGSVNTFTCPGHPHPSLPPCDRPTTAVSPVSTIPPPPPRSPLGYTGYKPATRATVPRHRLRGSEKMRPSTNTSRADALIGPCPPGSRSRADGRMVPGQPTGGSTKTYTQPPEPTKIVWPEIARPCPSLNANGTAN